MTTKRQHKIIRSQPAPRYLAGFVSERRAALLSMDREKILAYMHKWQADKLVIDMMEADELVFWGGVHKARVACPELPKYERDQSRRWLKLNNPDAKAAPRE
jgi:hypothetical protein